MPAESKIEINIDESEQPIEFVGSTSKKWEKYLVILKTSRKMIKNWKNPLAKIIIDDNLDDNDITRNLVSPPKFVKK